MLLAQLMNLQKNLAESDAEFAQRLGIPRSTWQLTRSGVKPLGRRVAVAARGAFPGLRGTVNAFLLADEATDAANTTATVA